MVFTALGWSKSVKQINTFCSRANLYNLVYCCCWIDVVWNYPTPTSIFFLMFIQILSFYIQLPLNCHFVMSNICMLKLTKIFLSIFLFAYLIPRIGNQKHLMEVCGFYCAIIIGFGEKKGGSLLAFAPLQHFPRVSTHSSNSVATSCI